MKQRKALVCGAGGFIGGHLVQRLKEEGYWVKGVDLVKNQFNDSQADEFEIGDLRDPYFVNTLFSNGIDEVFQLAADMGGAGYIFTGDKDANIIRNSSLINLNVLEAAKNNKVEKIFYSSSACIYPKYNQEDPDNPKCSEDSAYPAQPDSDYGWEKLFSERLFLSYQRNYGVDVKIARFHNVYGPNGIWEGGKEKAPAALCRKVAIADDGDTIEVWGDGRQTRSFLFIEDCLEGIMRFMRSEFHGPLNIGSEEMISINDYVKLIVSISNKQISIKNISGPVGVAGRNSNNRLIRKELNWEPRVTLREGTEILYNWIAEEAKKKTLVN